ncbi:MAG: Cof-type HAD-IIB family hydrolase [Candidatus Gastranaerophilales bacterium]|nr:Cof-type HAD-IIB family hydrolase [Candidatus Gastranaerophilales bacterium]
MKKNIKLIVLDIDGTIVGKSTKPSERVKKAIKKVTRQGVKVVIATGRMYEATYPLLEELGLDTPCINYQGAVIRDRDKIYREIKLPKNLVMEVANALRPFDVQVNLYAEGKLIVEKVYDCLANYIGIRHIGYKKVDRFEDLHDAHFAKLVAIDDNKDKVSEIRDIFAEKYKGVLNVVKSTDNYCEFVDIEASKGKSIKFLAGMWGLKTDEIMAAGDQDNDIDMIEAAGFGVAMANGSPDIKKNADFIAPDVEEDGIAQVIEKFVLND